jgi:hypothetical protein
MATGTITTYGLTTGVKLDVEDMIWTITPFDVPLLGTQGSDGRTAISQTTVFEKKIEWLDEVLLIPNSTLGATVATTDTYITVASGTQLNFQTGDVLRVGTGAAAEGMLVTGYGTTANTLTVTRQYNFGTEAQFLAGTSVLGTGQANAEGADAGTARAVDRVDRYNLTQIFGPVPVQVSGTENAVQKYGLTGTEFDHQVANRIKETFVSLEQALLYGMLYDDGAAKRTMGGFVNYITTNVDSTSTTLTDTTLLGNLRNTFNAGGTPDRILLGAKQKQNVSGINNSNIRYAQDTNTRGQVVDYYDDDFGRQLVVLDRWAQNSDAFIFSRDQATVATLRPLTFEMLAKTGDSAKGQVVGEKSLYFRRQAWASWMQALV